jgi:hypothetical protein
MRRFRATSARLRRGERSQLAPNLAQAHAALGLVLRQGPAAQAELRRALELDPNNIQALIWLTSTLNPYTEDDELLELARRGSEIEPLSADYVEAEREQLGPVGGN